MAVSKKLAELRAMMEAMREEEQKLLQLAADTESGLSSESQPPLGSNSKAPPKKTSNAKIPPKQTANITYSNRADQTRLSKPRQKRSIVLVRSDDEQDKNRHRQKRRLPNPETTNTNRNRSKQKAHRENVVPDSDEEESPVIQLAHRKKPVTTYQQKPTLPESDIDDSGDENSGDGGGSSADDSESDVPRPRLKPGPKKKQVQDSAEFRRRLNERMGVCDPDHRLAEIDKRAKRKFVLEGCLKRGVDCRKSFRSYSFNKVMYPAIKYIESIIPEEWDWDRDVIADVIRTLCWDRVRSQNRRDREVEAIRAKLVRKDKSSHKNKSRNGKSDLIREKGKRHAPDTADELSRPAAKASKHTSRAATTEPISKKKESSQPHPTKKNVTPIDTMQLTSPVQPIRNFPVTSPVSGSVSGNDDTELHSPIPAFRNDEDNNSFKVSIGKKRFNVSRDMAFNDFDNEVGLKIGSDDMLCYRSATGNKADRTWKPLNYTEEYQKMIERFGEVGVELKIYKKDDWFDEDRVDTDSELSNSPNNWNGGQNPRVQEMPEEIPGDYSVGVAVTPLSPPQAQKEITMRSGKNKAGAHIPPSKDNNTNKSQKGKGPEMTGSRNTNGNDEDFYTNEQMSGPKTLNTSTKSGPGNKEKPMSKSNIPQTPKTQRITKQTNANSEMMIDGEESNEEDRAECVNEDEGAPDYDQEKGGGLKQGSSIVLVVNTS